MRFDEPTSGEEVGLQEKRRKRLRLWRQTDIVIVICSSAFLLLTFLIIFGLAWTNGEYVYKTVIPDRFVISLFCNFRIYNFLSHIIFAWHRR